MKTRRIVMRVCDVTLLVGALALFVTGHWVWGILVLVLGYSLLMVGSYVFRTRYKLSDRYRQLRLELLELTGRLDEHNSLLSRDLHIAFLYLPSVKILGVIQYFWRIQEDDLQDGGNDNVLAEEIIVMRPSMPIARLFTQVEVDRRERDDPEYGQMPAVNLRQVLSRHRNSMSNVKMHDQTDLLHLSEDELAELVAQLRVAEVIPKP
jgi:hypothetical protein